MTLSTGSAGRAVGITRRSTLGLMMTATVAYTSLGRAVYAQTAKPQLNLAFGAEPNGFDAGRVPGGNDYLFFANVFEGLYSHDKDGALVPALAEKIDVSEDGLTLTVALRKGAKFHNGDPVTAEDIRFSWQRGIDPDMKNPRANVILRNIRDVEVVDEENCRIILEKPDAAFLDNTDQYWYIVPKKYIEAIGNEEFGKRPIGTGPFQFVEYLPRTHIKLKGFEDHWGRVPEVGDVTVYLIPDDQARIAKLQTGEVDIITAVPPILAPMLDADPNLQILSMPTFENVAVGINASFSANPDMKKVAVRQALNMAIDKETLIKTLMRGYVTIAGPPCVEGVEGCEADKVPGPYPYDPERAKKMLEEAGFDFSRPLNYMGLAPGRTANSKEVGEAIAGMLGKIGVKVNITSLDYGAWISMYAAKEKDPQVDLFFSTLTDYNPDPSGRLTRLFRTGGTFNWYSDPKTDEMLDQINNFVDIEARREHIRNLFTHLHEAAPQIFLWAMNATYGTRKSISWEPARNVSWPILWNVKKSV